MRRLQPSASTQSEIRWNEDSASVADRMLPPSFGLGAWHIVFQLPGGSCPFSEPSPVVTMGLLNSLRVAASQQKIQVRGAMPTLGDVMDKMYRRWIVGIVLGAIVSVGLCACNSPSDAESPQSADSATADTAMEVPDLPQSPGDAAAALPPEDSAVSPSDYGGYDASDPPQHATPSIPRETASRDEGALPFPSRPPTPTPPPPLPSPVPDEPTVLDRITPTGSRAPPSWRTSVKARGCSDCDVTRQVQHRKDYALDILLSDSGDDVEGGKPSEIMLQQIPEGESKTFKLVPLFVNGLMPLNDTDAQPVEFVVREPDEPGLWGYATLQFAVMPKAKKCASLVVSVWDVTLTVAYDAFLITLPVGMPEKPSRCADPLRPGTFLSGPSLVSVSDVFQPPVAITAPEARDRISLYAFELPIKQNSYVFAVIDPLHGSTTVSGWKLKTPLSESFGLQAAAFNKAAQRDRERMNGAHETEWIYERTAKFIKKKLFTAEYTSGGTEPSKVFEQLRTVINRDGASANVMAQIFVPIAGSDESGLMFLPLRTLAGPNSAYFKDFLFASPLPGAGEDEAEAAACVSTWKLVLNTSLAGSTGESADAQSSTQAAVERLAALEAKPWRAATMTGNEAIRDFFQNQDDPDDQAGSTGIIIAAHYGRRSLGLEGDEIAVEDLTAYRAPHSVAVLAACETAAPSEANGIIRGLREQNVDAFLASPLRVPTDYAIRFVESLVKQIDLAYANGAQPTLEELYATSMDNVDTQSEGQRIEARNLGREFVVVGDASRRLCKLPVTGADGYGASQNP